MGNLNFCALEDDSDDQPLIQDSKKVPRHQIGTKDLGMVSTASKSDSNLTIHYKRASIIDSIYIQRSQLGSCHRSSKCFTYLIPCQYCYTEIEQGCIITSCEHNYHKKCLRALLQQQISIAKSIPSCSCGTKIHFQLFQALGDNILVETYLKNQLAQLKKAYPQIRKCKRAECDFIYYQVGESPSYCPICMQ